MPLKDSTETKRWAVKKVEEVGWAVFVTAGTPACKLENMILVESGLSLKRDKPVFIHWPYFEFSQWPDAL